ncbi:MAG: sugar phosphate isomerase/epimerase [Anaerolineae bacterium]|nr:sugar phosphate isomerase/epimerase [Anaerolineae bacterium]
MNNNLIGINQAPISSRNAFQQLERQLAHFQSLGFSLVEIDITPFHLIINGEIHRPSLDTFLAVVRDFDLHYSVHGLQRLNLAYDSRHALCRQIMRCQIEICRAMGAMCLVYHSGLQALDEARYGVRRTLLDDRELAAGARQEVLALKELAPIAEDGGVLIGMENGDTHQWEHDLIARFGQPRTALSHHHPRIHIEPIVRQIQAIDRPNVGLTLDVGHLHIAAHDMGFDYLEAIEQAAPWLKHVHLSDNLGQVDRGFDNEPDRWAFGEADIHMPPGWGAIPYREIFARWPDYSGAIILEIKSSFGDYAEEGLHTLENLQSC